MNQPCHESTLSSGARTLLGKARNVNSQTGEDGIIAAILAELTIRDRWCVEFGAWDGRYLSNTRRLIDEENYSAVMIEANKRTFGQLKAAFASEPRVHCVQSLVGYGENDNLDAILSTTPCPREFDVLSIDIDGNDIHVWEATRTFRPKVVVIEINPTISIEVRFSQPRDPNRKWGSSLRAVFELGQSKGYRLVCTNLLNAFFVAEEHWTGDYCKMAADLPRFREAKTDPVYVFSGYDGTVLLSSDTVLSWHSIPVRQGDVQVMPSFLRRYPDDYSLLQRVCYRVFARFHRVAEALQ